MKNRDGADYYHLATAVDEEAAKAGAAESAPIAADVAARIAQWRRRRGGGAAR